MFKFMRYSLNHYLFNYYMSYNSCYGCQNYNSCTNSINVIPTPTPAHHTQSIVAYDFFYEFDSTNYSTVEQLQPVNMYNIVDYDSREDTTYSYTLPDNLSGELDRVVVNLFNVKSGNLTYAIANQGLRLQGFLTNAISTQYVNEIAFDELDYNITNTPLNAQSPLQTPKPTFTASNNNHLSINVLPNSSALTGILQIHATFYVKFNLNE